MTRYATRLSPSIQPDDDVRLLHLREAAALRFTEGRTRSDLDDDEKLRLALMKLVEIVGEAAKQVSVEGQAEYPAMAWSAAARMRDRLVGPQDIDVDVLWATIRGPLLRRRYLVQLVS